MSNEGASQTVSLKEHFESLLDEHDKRYSQKFDDMQRALNLAREESEKKNAELNDVRHRFIPREVFDSYREQQVRRSRAIIVTFVLMGLTIIGLVFQIIATLKK
jgi:hypothetical protein